MTLPAKTMSQIRSLSADDMLLVSNLVEHLSADSQKRKRHIGIIGLCGLVSLKISDFLTHKDSMSDDEVDSIIASVRKKNHANRR